MPERTERMRTGRREVDEGRGGWMWPLAIALGLMLVIAVNAAFIVVAVTGADEVVESYMTEER